MKTNLILFSVVIILFFGAVYFVYSINQNGKLVTPSLSSTNKITSTPAPTPLPTAKSFSFNKDTDLAAEVESVDPKVNDTDFDGLSY
jgi:hypothetical protein